MKSTEEQKVDMSVLNVVDLEELKVLVSEMESLRKEQVNTDNLMKIENVCRSLNAFREKYQYRVINLLKKGWI